MLSKLKTVILRIIRIFNISSKYIGPPKGSLTTQEWIQKRFPTYHPPYIPIYDQKIIEEKPPRTISGQEISWRFRSLHRRLVPLSFVLKISNGRVWGANGAVITDDDYLLSDVSREWLRNMYRNQHSVIKQLFLGKPEIIKGNVAVIATAGADRYYHWMFDILPRFELLKKAGIFNEIDYFVLPPLKFPFQIESIAKTGIDANKLIFSDTVRFHLQAEQLFVPSLPSLLGTVDKWTCEFLRDLFLVNDSIKSGHPEYIYISRNQASNRKLRNEKEVLSFLKPLGFEIIENEDLSIEEQAEIFNNAKCIIAPHGGGLSNIVFCQEHCKVIDIFPPSYVIPCFWVISNQLNLDYYYLVGEGKETREFEEYWKSVNDDIILDLSYLEQIIAGALTV